MLAKELETFMTSFHKEVITFVHSFDSMEGYTCSLKMDWSARRTMSRGGWYKKGPGVSYAMLRLTEEITRGHMVEYVSFKTDPIIGEIFSTDWRTIAKALACHEQAHAICGFLDKNNKERHRKNWKTQYAVLREKFVNNDKGRSLKAPRPTEVKGSI